MRKAKIKKIELFCQQVKHARLCIILIYSRFKQRSSLKNIDFQLSGLKVKTNRKIKADCQHFETRSKHTNEFATNASTNSIYVDQMVFITSPFLNVLVLLYKGVLIENMRGFSIVCLKESCLTVLLLFAVVVLNLLSAVYKNKREFPHPRCPSALPIINTASAQWPACSLICLGVRPVISLIENPHHVLRC